MTDPETLVDRLDAVERALTDGETDLAALEDEADLTGRVDALADRLDVVERRVADLEAATQAIRGYVGNVKAVDDEVERRADLALARVETVERLLEDEGIGEPFQPADPPPVDPGAGEGWRDAGDAAPFDTAAGDSDATTDPSPDAAPLPDTDDSPGDAVAGPPDGADEDGRPDDLRAAIDRLREAL